MEHEFDKEMDSLLRKTAKGVDVFAAESPLGEHIDADEISMFAENALPEKAKPRVMKHLASCGRCRTILSNVIALNSEAEAEVASAVSTSNETVVASTKIPWYEKLFATKNLAFGMGALALVFAVGIGFVVVQNITNTRQSEMAKTDSSAGNAAPETSALSDASEPLATDNSNANVSNDENKAEDLTEEAAQSRSQAPSAKTDSSPPTDVVADKKTDSAKNKNKKSDEGFATGVSKSDVREEMELKDADDATMGDKAPSPVARARKPKLKAESNTTDSSAEAAVAQPQAAPRKTSPITTRGSTVRRDKPVEKAKKSRKPSAKENRYTKLPGTKRQVNGKTFIRKNNTWTDSRYKGQRTTKVRRGTSQYRNLDSGLRSISDELRGTVVIVWKSKAYEIK